MRTDIIRAGLLPYSSETSPARSEGQPAGTRPGRRGHGRVRRHAQRGGGPQPRRRANRGRPAVEVSKICGLNLQFFQDMINQTQWLLIWYCD